MVPQLLIKSKIILLFLIILPLNKLYLNKCDVRFVERTNENDYIFIDWMKMKCKSVVGKKGGRQVVRVGNCKKNDVLHYGLITHELMHVAGAFSNNIFQIL